VRKNAVVLLVAGLLAQLLVPSAAPAFTVKGSVRQQLNLTGADLARFAATDARLADFTKDKQYNGVFDYQGVPLQTILRLADIQKTGDGFNKNTDLAVVVRNREGREVVLSWGEVFYKNPSNVIVAFSFAPVLPHSTGGCAKCHVAEFYQPALDKLKRKVGLPKLVLPNDFYSDRSLEEIVSIEVVDLGRDSGRKPVPEPSAAKFTLTDLSGKSAEFTDLSRFSRRQVDFKNIGDGRGFHGFRQFAGAPVRELLGGVAGGQEPDQALLVTATDGYQGLYSFGEIFLSPLGERIIIAEQQKGAGGAGKSFSFVDPDDTAADRMIKNISKIEVISFRQRLKVKE
jgi:hypothetical protein